MPHESRQAPHGAHVRARRALLRAAALLASVVCPGCGGYTIHRPFLLGMDSRVEWVFQAPAQFGTGSVIGAILGLGQARVGGAMRTDDDKLIALTNYGTWFAPPSNLYLLDLASGRVIRHVGGLSNSGREWYLDGRTVYLVGRRGDRQMGQPWRNETWWAIDLRTGRVRKGLPGPEGQKQKAFRPLGYHRETDWNQAPVPSRIVPQESSTSRTKTHNELGGGRELVFTVWRQWVISSLLGPRIPIMYLTWTDTTGKRHTRRLGRLRYVNPAACHVLVDDERRLVFCTGSYVICLDMRGLPRRSATTQPAEG